MQTFVLTSISPMGDPHPQYGQTYWAEAQGSDVSLMFSTNNVVEAGATVSCEESVNKTSKSGKPYMLLKSVKVQVPGFQADVKTPSNTDAPSYGKKHSYGRDDSAIKAQWAIGQAVQLVNSGQIKHDDIEPQAMEFFSMVERVKNPPEVGIEQVFEGAEQIEIPGDN